MVYDPTRPLRTFKPNLPPVTPYKRLGPLGPARSEEELAAQRAEVRRRWQEERARSEATPPSEPMGLTLAPPEVLGQPAPSAPAAQPEPAPAPRPAAAAPQDDFDAQAAAADYHRQMQAGTAAPLEPAKPGLVERLAPAAQTVRSWGRDMVSLGESQARAGAEMGLAAGLVPTPGYLPGIPSAVSAPQLRAPEAAAQVSATQGPLAQSAARERLDLDVMRGEASPNPYGQRAQLAEAAARQATVEALGQNDQDWYALDPATRAEAVNRQRAALGLAPVPQAEVDEFYRQQGFMDAPFRRALDVMGLETARQLQTTGAAMDALGQVNQGTADPVALNEARRMMQGQAEAARPGSLGYQVGAGLAETAPFMVEMAGTAGAGTAAKLAARQGLKALTSRLGLEAAQQAAARALAAEATERTAKQLGLWAATRGVDLAADTAGRLAVSAPKIAALTGKELTPEQIAVREDGSLAPVAKEGTLGAAILKTLASQGIETFSEGLGGGFGKLAQGMGLEKLTKKGMELKLRGGLARLAEKMGKGALAGRLKALARAGRWDGFVNEWLEEDAATFLNYLGTQLGEATGAQGLADLNQQTATIYGAEDAGEQLATRAGVLAGPQGLFGGANVAAAGIDLARRSGAERRMTKDWAEAMRESLAEQGIEATAGELLKLRRRLKQAPDQAGQEAIIDEFYDAKTGGPVTPPENRPLEVPAEEGQSGNAQDSRDPAQERPVAGGLDERTAGGVLAAGVDPLVAPDGQGAQPVPGNVAGAVAPPANSPELPDSSPPTPPPYNPPQPPPYRAPVEQTMPDGRRARFVKDGQGLWTGSIEGIPGAFALPPAKAAELEGRAPRPDAAHLELPDYGTGAPVTAWAAGGKWWDTLGEEGAPRQVTEPELEAAYREEALARSPVTVDLGEGLEARRLDGQWFTGGENQEWVAVEDAEARAELEAGWREARGARATAKTQTAVPAAAVAAREAASGQTQAEASKYEFSSTQVNLPPAESAAVRAAGARIAEEDLGGDGRERQPHITVKYGLHTDQADDVARLLAGEPPIRVRLGKTSLFEPSKGSDGMEVVKVDVDSPDLRRLNAKIAAALQATDTHPDYTPHVTLAYVKPGAGKKYAGQDWVAGREIVLDRLVFSGKNGEQVEIPLGGDPAAAPVSPPSVNPEVNTSAAPTGQPAAPARLLVMRNAAGERYEVDRADAAGVDWMERHGFRIADEKGEAGNERNLDREPAHRLSGRPGGAAGAGADAGAAGGSAPAAPRRAMLDRAQSDLGRSLGRAAVLEEAPAPKAVAEFLDALGEALGAPVLRVRVTDEQGRDLKINGVYVAGAILIDAKASDPAAVVALHEALHLLRRESPDLYQTILETYRELRAQGGIEAAGERQYADKLQALRQKRGLAPLSPDILLEELLADLSGDFARTKPFWDRLYQRSPRAFRRLAEAIARAVDAMLARLKGQKPANKAAALVFAKNTKALERMRRSVADALAARGERLAEARGFMKPKRGAAAPAVKTGLDNMRGTQIASRLIAMGGLSHNLYAELAHLGAFEGQPEWRLKKLIPELDGREPGPLDYDDVAEMMVDVEPFQSLGRGEDGRPAMNVVLEYLAENMFVPLNTGRHYLRELERDGSEAEYERMLSAMSPEQRAEYEAQFAAEGVESGPTGDELPFSLRPEGQDDLFLGSTGRRAEADRPRASVAGQGDLFAATRREREAKAEKPADRSADTRPDQGELRNDQVVRPAPKLTGKEPQQPSLFRPEANQGIEPTSRLAQEQRAKVGPSDAPKDVPDMFGGTRFSLGEEKGSPESAARARLDADAPVEVVTAKPNFTLRRKEAITRVLAKHEGGKRAVRVGEAGREYYISGTALNKMTAALGEGGKPKLYQRERIAAIQSLDELAAAAVETAARADDGRDENVATVREFHAPFYLEGQLYRVRLLTKEFMPSLNLRDKLHSMAIEDVLMEKVPADRKAPGGAEQRLEQVGWVGNGADEATTPSAPSTISIGQLMGWIKKNANEGSTAEVKEEERRVEGLPAYPGEASGEGTPPNQTFDRPSGSSVTPEGGRVKKNAAEKPEDGDGESRFSLAEGDPDAPAERLKELRAEVAGAAGKESVQKFERAVAARAAKAERERKLEQARAATEKWSGEPMPRSARLDTLILEFGKRRFRRGAETGKDEMLGQGRSFLERAIGAKLIASEGPQTPSELYPEIFKAGKLAAAAKEEFKGLRPVEDVIRQGFSELAERHKGDLPHLRFIMERIDEDIALLEKVAGHPDNDGATVRRAIERALGVLFGGERRDSLLKLAGGSARRVLNELRRQLDVQLGRIHARELSRLVGRVEPAKLYNEPLEPGADPDAVRLNYREQWEALLEQHAADSEALGALRQLGGRLRRQKDYLAKVRKDGGTAEAIKEQEERIAEIKRLMGEAAGEIHWRRASELWKKLSEIEAASDRLQEEIVTGRKVWRAVAGDEVQGEIEAAHPELKEVSKLDRDPRRRGWLKNLLVDARGDLESWLLNLAGGNENSFLYQIGFKALRLGKREADNDYVAMLRALEAVRKRLGVGLMEIIDWRGRKHDFELMGSRHQFSEAQIMALYALSRDKEAWLKLLKNGMKSIDNKNQSELGRNVLRGKGEDLEEIVAGTEAMAQKLLAKLSPKQRAMAEAMAEILNTYARAEGNKTSLKIFGYEKFLNPDHWRMRVDAGASAPQEDRLDALRGYGADSLERLGMLKARVPHANPLMIEDIFMGFDEQARQLADFTRLAIPTLDVMNLINHKGARTAITRRFGTKMLSAIRETLLLNARLKENTDGNDFKRIAAGIMRRYAVYRLSTNLTSGLKNWIGGSLALAAELGKMDPRLKGLGAKLRVLQPNQAARWTGRNKEIFDALMENGFFYLRWKNDPVRSFGNVPSDREQMMGKVRLYWRIVESGSMMFMARAEQNNAIQAVKLALDRGYTLEEAVNLVEIATSESQNPSRALEDSGINRALKESGMGLLLPFYGQVSVQANMVLKDYLRLAYARRAGDEAARAKAWSDLRATLSAYAGIALFSAALAGATAFIRSGGAGGEDDKKKLGPLALSRWRNLLMAAGEFAGNFVPGAGGIVEAVGFSGLKVAAADKKRRMAAARAESARLVRELSTIGILDSIVRPGEYFVRDVFDIIERDGEVEGWRIERTVMNAIDAFGSGFGMPLGGAMQATRLAAGALGHPLGREPEKPALPPGARRPKQPKKPRQPRQGR